VSKPRRAWLDRADHIVALLDAAGELDREAQPRCGHRRVLIATLVFAGLRISEALALRRGEIDLARGTLRVDQAKTDAGSARSTSCRSSATSSVSARLAVSTRPTSWCSLPAPGEPSPPPMYVTDSATSDSPCQRNTRTARRSLATQRDHPTRAAPHVRLVAVRDRGVTALRHQPARARNPSPHPRNLRTPDEPTRRRAGAPTRPSRGTPPTRHATNSHVPMKRAASEWELGRPTIDVCPSRPPGLLLPAPFGGLPVSAAIRVEAIEEVHYRVDDVGVALGQSRQTNTSTICSPWLLTAFP
jgi:Phage integrase family